MTTNKSHIQKRAMAYSFLAHIRENGTFADGPLDIFIPIVKNAMSELYPDGQVSGASLLEIADDIENRFDLSIPTTVLKIILQKIAEEVNNLSGKNDMVIYDDGSFIINKFIFEEYKELIQRSKQEVNKVLSLFKGFFKINNPKAEPSEADLLMFFEQNRTDISYYLANKIKEEDIPNSAPAQFVDMFRKIPEVYDVLRNMYLGSMLTSYLSYQPQNVKMDVELLLDTNFIVSYLDLNTPESTAICRTFIETSKSLGYSITVLKDTVEETQSLLKYKAEYLNQAIIAKSINKEDIFNACDRLHLSSVDLERISDNLEEKLTNDFGFHVIPNTEKLKSKARYSEEYKIFKEVRSSKKSALHDAMAVIYVKEKRGGKPIYEFNKVNCWFVNNAISHSNENDTSKMQPCQGGLSETIKVDSLLNIIWLSNPSNGAENTDFIDMGIASMVSYALNSTLPKARVIKELDENIQKYKDDFSITDKDVVNLSTRIVQRQIVDVQTFNEIAVQKGGAEFAEQVKLESSKQEEIEKKRAEKLDSLMNIMDKRIHRLQQHEKDLLQKNNERITLLDEKEEELHKKEACINSKIMEDSILHNMWKKENEEKERLWKKYQEKGVKKYKRIWNISLCVVVISIVILPLLMFFWSKANEFISDNKLAISAVGILISGIIVYNYNYWCATPKGENELKSTLERPEYLQQISYDDFLKKNK